jgi:hypothetical protein
MKDKYQETKDEMYDSTEETYNDESDVIRPMNVNRPLAKLLGIPEYKCDNDTKNTWEAPNTHGLNNSSHIIPPYYISNNERMFNLNFYDIIKDDIRNYRKLTKYQMDYILQMSEYDKNELLVLFNECMKNLIDIITS